jgi:hypothetical protein
MAHVLLIIERPGARAALPEEEGRARYERMLRFSADLEREGVLVRSEALSAATDAVRVSRQEGREQVRDGPFAEAKEMIGGFFLLTGTTRAAALAIARRCPAAEWAIVEVRSLGPCYE